ncbi:MAG: ubiquinol-cytochrome c reductase iron-sulfur subunit [Deltaproteobacteria bacterium]|nr:MAG: ubiquinol-cytochrome c reductase iron-sulfur subunit [Deltaproteobacteria bacterium]
MKEEHSERAGGTESTRRSFLNNLWIGLGLVALAEIVAVAFAFFRANRSRARQVDPEAIVTAGDVDKFVPNSVTAFVRGRFYLARLKDGGFLALSRKCTHLGCTVPWVEKELKFVCPCHASAFDITGNVIGSPAPRPLDIYPVSIENRIVKVDTSKVIKRSEFRAEQITQP